MREVTIERVDGTVVCEHCAVADGPVSRMRGLLGRASLATGSGILLRPASSIHMWFMRFPIDAAFIDDDLRVLRVSAALQPWRIAAERGAKAVLEIAAGEAEQRGLRAGEQLRLRER